MPPARAATPKAAVDPRRNGRPTAPGYDPLAPRLRKPGPPPDRPARDRESKRLKARLVELEKRIAEKEQAVKALEAQMAAAGFYDDRARAEQATEEHKKLMWEVGDLMARWESLQTEVDEGAQA